MEHASRAPEPTKGFSDPTRLTNWTRGFLYASITAALLGMWSSARALPGGRGEAELDTGLRVTCGCSGCGGAHLDSSGQ